MLKIRRPLGRLIFNMGIAIPGKTVFLIETDPCFWHNPHWNRKLVTMTTFCRGAISLSQVNRVSVDFIDLRFPYYVCAYRSRIAIWLDWPLLRKHGVKSNHWWNRFRVFVWDNRLLLNSSNCSCSGNDVVVGNNHIKRIKNTLTKVWGNTSAMWH